MRRLPDQIQPTILSLILTLALPPLPLTALALILGAPLYPPSLIPYTFLLSVHVSLLAILPLFYTHGVSGFVWRDVMAAWLPFDEAGVWGGFVGCFVGGWIGAVPMALDWDRDWQAWPIPVVTGVYLGWAVGRVLTGDLKLGIGRRIDMSVASQEQNEGTGLTVEDVKKTK
jgi:GPI ethanolamine phosphate transferase 2/3 subunit F